MARAPTARPTFGFSLRDFDYADQVARLRHFGRAAEACGVSQSALSEQIRKLEDRLGMPLFERTKRRVAPTADAEGFLEQIARVLQEAERLADMAERRRADGGLRLRVGAIETLGPYYLPRVLATLRKARPDISLRLVEAKTEALTRALSRGELDVAFLATPPTQSGLAAASLFREPFLFAAPVGHPLTLVEPLAIEALAGPDLLLLEEGHCLRDQALALCGGRPATRHATSVETLWQMIASGEGYSLLPALAVESRPSLHAFVVVRALSNAAAERRISLCWRASDPRGGDYLKVAAVLRRDAPAACRAAPD